MLNKLSAELPQKTRDQLIQSVKGIAEQLPFLVDLSKKERTRMAKLSRRYVDFVDRGLVHARSNPHYLPAYLNMEEFEKDVALRANLYQLYNEVMGVAEKIKDTILLADSEAYQAARLLYKSVKAAAREGAEGADSIVRDLAFHYKKKGTPNGDNDQKENEAEPVAE